MSIEKESTGMPEINVHRRTTKVNLWMIVAIIAFFAVSAMAAYLISRQSASPVGEEPRAADGTTGKNP